MARCRAYALLFLLLIAYPAAHPETTQSSTKQTQRERKAQTPASAKRPQAATSAERTVAERWIRNLTLRDKIAQLVIITSYGEAPSSRSTAYRDYVRAVRDLKVGGMIVVNRVVSGTVRNAEPHAMAAFLNRMQRLARVPLIVGGDFERGASMRVRGRRSIRT